MDAGSWSDGYDAERKPLPNVLHLPCRKCGGPRNHFGVGRCWDCMRPEEKERFKNA